MKLSSQTSHSYALVPKSLQQDSTKKSTKGLELPPDNRHTWDQSLADKMDLLRKVATPLLFRQKDVGFENIPTDGTYIVGPTHQSMFDALLASKVPDGPVGSMAAIDQFSGFKGKLLSGNGAYPVDRYKEYEGDFPDPVEHAAEILDQGSHFLFYPEGKIFRDGMVHPLKTGVGRIAVCSEAKYALPVAQHFAADAESQPLETAVGIAGSVLAGGAGYLLGSQGRIAATLGGLMAGTIPGVAVGSLMGWEGVGDNELAAGLKAAKKGLKFGAITAAATAAASFFFPDAAPYIVGAASGLTGLALTYYWTHRPVATTAVGKPVALEPYRKEMRASQETQPWREGAEVSLAQYKAGLKVTADFHEALAETKAQVTGKSSRYKMDYQGNSWMKRDDETWVQVDFSRETKQWEPVPGVPPGTEEPSK